MPRQKCYVSDTNEAPIYDAAYIPAKIELCLNIIRFVFKHNSEFWRNINTNIVVA